uniref:ribosomal protein S12 n=1 Tax=Pseudoceramium tenerrimum TaxID=196911 RepID=UPI002E76C235|nr:ribosomal protein S12 [Pseudoceramium tenerrimum]WQF69734.1 ribosomal protein S12 [Pseudoceramium tenerrimum]WQF69770.1 ribosomal protein S12 [Pseudoceramium tenerrimum]
MPSIQQLLKKKRVKKLKVRKSSSLDACPQKKSICLKVYSASPKKPNSASRKVARVRLSSKKVVIGYIPGEGHSLQEHSVVLLRGGKVKDLPGVHYHLVRGVFDLPAVTDRRQSRSKYGKKRNS